MRIFEEIQTPVQQLISQLHNKHLSEAENFGLAISLDAIEQSVSALLQSKLRHPLPRKFVQEQIEIIQRAFIQKTRI
jgi:hypothetical protein